MKELRDQSAHFVAAILSLLPAMLWPGVWSFAWAGFCLGTVREVTELEVPFTLAKLKRAILSSKLDLTFWTLGAATAAYITGV